ncbi:hypothetical protein [Prosthecodimorpha staleyi]|uniref:Uncharacterized protein n=1 Tax=Prosthecodimorpha staleyi TaxID=2840188 RepID=A0A947GCI4_9HYPH|nr:hypothetical protein [Prosthecodimorpha staleyi]MBT9291453.1 hypothetical protein [Prosthecodimorpha staleyi]
MPIDDFAEYEFVIHGSSPETLPMTRLADYLADLASLFGSKDAVHFDRVSEGSACLKARVEQQAKPSVSPRIRGAAVGEGSPAVLNAFRKLNDKLAEDGTTGEMRLPGGQVIPFPGSPLPEPTIGPIRQRTTLQGRLVRIEGAGEVIWLGIEDDTNVGGRISMSAACAQEVGRNFHRYVRFVGEGTWRRDSAGRWSLDRLDAESFEPLDDDPLAGVLGRIRELLPDDAAAETARIISDWKTP